MAWRNLGEKTLIHLCTVNNCTPHDTLGFSPYSVVIDMDPKLAVDLMFGVQLGRTEENHTQFVKKLNKEMEYCNKFVRKHSKIKPKRTNSMTTIRKVVV